jgi:hypothetical protein
MRRTIVSSRGEPTIELVDRKDAVAAGGAGSTQLTTEPAIERHPIRHVRVEGRSTFAQHPTGERDRTAVPGHRVMAVVA